MANLALYQTISFIRQFFREKSFIETPAPPLVSNPGMEAHLHPFKVSSLVKSENRDLYLHTSPEFFLKKLLSEGMENIYSLGYCFRDEPSSETHRPQFLMLEWYRANSFYDVIQEDAISLIKFVHKNLNALGLKTIPEVNIERFTVEELFIEYAHFSILENLNVEELKEKIHSHFPDLLNKEQVQDDWPWEDLFFLVFLNKIEPHFKEKVCVVVDQFPAPLSALSTIKKDDPRVCERFEIYLRGVELCNCFNELTSLHEQKNRMDCEKKKKMKLYGYELPEPNVLYKALEKGIPQSAGIALGVERLLLGLSADKEATNPFNE